MRLQKLLTSARRKTTMANDSDDTRQQGIEFGELIGELKDESYPLSHETLLSRYGDRELGLFDNQVPLSEVLLPDEEQEYEDMESVKQAVFNMVDDDAIGRKEYSDRGGSSTNIDDSADSESF